MGSCVNMKPVNGNKDPLSTKIYKLLTFNFSTLKTSSETPYEVGHTIIQSE